MLSRIPALTTYSIMIQDYMWLQIQTIGGIKREWDGPIRTVLTLKLKIAIN